MIVRLELEHSIRGGREKEALELIKELDGNGLERPASTPGWRGLLLYGDFLESEAVYSYRDRLRVLSRFRPLSDAPARIRIYLTP